MVQTLSIDVSLMSCQTDLKVARWTCQVRFHVETCIDERTYKIIAFNFDAVYLQCPCTRLKTQQGESQAIFTQLSFYNHVANGSDAGEDEAERLFQAISHN
jgi:hypothetical protein